MITRMISKYFGSRWNYVDPGHCEVAFHAECGHHRGMKKGTLGRISCLLALSFLAACGESNASAATAGVYDLDGKAMQEAFVEKAGKPESKMQKAVVAMMGASTGTLHLDADGTAKMTIKAPPQQTVEQTGTWQQDGSRITITTTDQNGTKATQTGTLEDGVLTTASAQAPEASAMIWRRKKSGN